MRFDVDAGTDVRLPPLSAPTFSSIVMSPDGTRVVYVASVRGGPHKLLTRRLDQTAFTELAGTEGASHPFFSRDGQWVGFWSGGAVFKVAVEGSGATKLADLPVMTGGDWNDVGDPQALPGGRHILFEVVTRSAPEVPTIDVASVADRQRRTIVRGGGSPRYLESGHLVYTNRSTMFAAPLIWSASRFAARPYACWTTPPSTR